MTWKDMWIIRVQNIPIGIDSSKELSLELHIIKALNDLIPIGLQMVPVSTTLAESISYKGHTSISVSGTSIPPPSMMASLVQMIYTCGIFNEFANETRSQVSCTKGFNKSGE